MSWKRPALRILKRLITKPFQKRNQPRRTRSFGRQRRRYAKPSSKILIGCRPTSTWGARSSCRRNTRQAAKVYGDALKIDPENKPAYLQLASAQEQAGDYGGAVATLQMLRAKETDPAALNRLDELIGRLKARQAAPGEQQSISGKGGAK